MESGPHTDSTVSPSSSDVAQQPPLRPNLPPSTGRNWVVILVVAVLGALMIFIAIRNTKKGSSIADRAAIGS